MVQDDLSSAFQMSFSEKLTFQNAPSPQEFNEEDNADIICDVISSPPPTIIWKYKNTRIQPEADGKICSTTSRSLSVSLFHSPNVILIFHYLHVSLILTFIFPVKIMCELS